jgi:carboxyl-terminal processing protease
MSTAVSRSIKFLLISCFSFSIACSFAEAPIKLVPSKDQSKSTIEIVQRLDGDHFRNQAIDDQLSSRFFDEYLKALDGSRYFLLQSDINEFEKFRKTFDDDFKKGKLTNAFAIYNRFNERLTARLEKVIADLENPSVVYTFDADEVMNSDRENAPWPINIQDADTLWHSYIKSNLLSSVLNGKSLEDSKKNMRKRYVNQLNRNKRVDAEDAYSIAMNSLTMLYDPHTNYMSPENAENFDINMSLKLQGIGAELRSDDEYTKVSRIIPASPAAKQGILQPNDRILAIAQGDKGSFVDVVGWRLDEVVKLIRGKKGTIVKLEVASAKADDSDTHVIVIKRDEIKLDEQAAKKAVFDVKTKNNNTYKLGVINLPAFYMDFEEAQKGNPNYRSATGDVFRLLRELTEANVDGVIIDLRNNGGGSLSEAAMLTDLFVDPGPVVQIRHGTDISRQPRAQYPAFYRGPIIVLVNRLSASASEIFAGAIQDYGRGLIVGEDTFGKGTVQNKMDLSHGDLKITEAKFYRISGASTQHRGVVPDIKLPDLLDIDEIGESSLDNALPWDTINPAPHRSYYKISQFLPKIETEHQERLEKDPEFVFIEKQRKLYESITDKKVFSLNLTKRQKEQQDIEQQSLQMENERRLAKGEKPYENYAALKAEKDPENEDEDPKPKDDSIKPAEDPHLQEAGHILADFIDQLNNSNLAKH